MNKVLVIAGPTAVGKTALSIELAKQFSGEIISGDSMQVYRKLDIGTAKVRPVEMQGIPHHLINIRELSEGYSVAEFQKEGRKLIAEITARNRLPIVVGGTGLYIQALLYDYRLGASDKSDATIRSHYQEYLDINGKEALWQQLQQKDPVTAAKIHPNNVRKVIRGLEVFELTGRSISEPAQEPKPLYDYFLLGLTTKRELLYERINQRVEQMMVQGLLQEAKLLENDQELQAAQGIGYKEFFPYFTQQQSLNETIAAIQQNSRRYAKRQLTWFNNRMTPRWADILQHPEEKEKIEEEIAQWLEESK